MKKIICALIFIYVLSLSAFAESKLLIFPTVVQLENVNINLNNISYTEAPIYSNTQNEQTVTNNINITVPQYKTLTDLINIEK